MEKTDSINDLIGLWPSRQMFASDVGANVEAVHKWAQSGRIPARWMQSVMAAAKMRGHRHITPEWMLAVHSAPHVGATQ